MPSCGLVTMPTLIMFREASDILKVSVLKRAAILFEHILFPTEMGIGELSRSQYLTFNGNPNIRNIDEATQTEAYYDIFLDIGDILENSKEYYTFLHEPSDEDLWGGDETDRFIQLCSDLLSDHFSNLELREMLKFVLPNLSDDIKTFKFFNELGPGYIPVISEWHIDIIGTLLNASEYVDPNSAMESINDANIPDFAQLSWNEILELRSDRRVNSFREKIQDIILRATQNDSNADVMTTIRNEIQNDLWNLLNDIEPDLETTIVSGILGNIPLPFPVNPFSLSASIQDIQNEFELRDRYGWLMFINKARQ